MSPENLTQKLQQEVEDLARFPEMNPGPVFRVNPEGEILLANSAANEIFGIPVLEEKNWLELCPDLTPEIWKKVRASDGMYGHEADVNERCYLFIHVNSDISDNTFVYGSDVTQIKLIERELEVQKETLSEMARFPDMNPGPVLRMRRNGCVVLANKAASAIFHSDRLVDQYWYDVCPELTREKWEELTADPGIQGHEADVGERCYLFTHVSPVAGEFCFVYGSDVTQIKLIEKELEEQRAAVRQMARFPDMNPGPVLRMEDDGSILLTNVAAKDVFGEVIGANWKDEILALNNAQWKEVLGSYRTPVSVELRLDERVFVFVHRREEESGNVFVFGTEITKQKIAERSLKQSEKMATLGTLAAGVAHELNNPAAATKRASENLKEQLTQLEKSHIALNTLNLSDEERQLIHEIDKMAHMKSMVPNELGTLQRSDAEAEIEDWLDDAGFDDVYDHAPALLNMGMDVDRLKVLLEQFGEDHFNKVLQWASALGPVYELLAEISEGSSRISEIVIALKNYSFVGQAPVQEIDLNHGIDNTLVILRSKLKGGIEVHREYADDIPKLIAFGGELNQVWTNIIDNAIDVMQGEGRITIRTKLDGDHAIIEFEDTGPGIPEDVIDEIFDPFFTTKKIGQGTGLGLSTSYGVIVEKHHGTISVESNPGKTCFRIRIPLKLSDVNDVE